ncbi:hypothetical protein CAL7716_059650 [Calothrix sp. PCC 7716]|nr:hypothetical protein CAL7716_059650 [Calothrix sp. PCC 7716]
MARGFAQAIKRKKLKLYASYNTEEVKIITTIEELGYKHGKDFLLDKRTYKILTTPTFTTDASQLISVLENLNSEEASQIIQQIKKGLVEETNLLSCEVKMLLGDAATWMYYKKIYNAQPPFINNFFNYSQEEMEAVLKECNNPENAIPDDTNLYKEYIIPFWAALEKKGYVYKFVSAPNDMELSLILSNSSLKLNM